MGGADLTWTSTIDWTNAGDMRFWSYQTLNTTWNFSGTNRINGNGNILDLTGGGIINVAANGKLYLTDIVIKGLGAGGGQINLATGATAYLSYATVEMAGSYTTSVGTFRVDGTSTIVVKDKTWTFNSSSLLVVDGQTLWKDPAGASTNGDLVFANTGTNLSLLKQGTIAFVGPVCC